MKSQIIFSITFLLSIIGVGILLRKTADPETKSRYEITVVGASSAVIALLDTQSGRVTTNIPSRDRDSSSYRDVVFPAPIAVDGESVDIHQIRKWRRSGYSDGQIYDTLALKYMHARVLWKGGATETEIVEDYLQHSTESQWRTTSAE